MRAAYRGDVNGQAVGGAVHGEDRRLWRTVANRRMAARGGVAGPRASTAAATRHRCRSSQPTQNAVCPMAARPAPSWPALRRGELGELFEYRIAQPVTIRKDESAMLPFLQQAIEARKLLIYSDHSSQHPTNAAELTNSTGKTLDGGPITVYDGGAYGGEALMETLKAGDKRLISYAVDLGTRITEAFGSKQAAGARDPRQSRHADHAKWPPGRDAHVHHPQCRPEGQDADPGAPSAARVHAAQPEAVGEDASAYRFEIALAADKYAGIRRQRRARLRSSRIR